MSIYVVMGLLVLGFCVMFVVMIPAMIFTRVEQQKKLEAELEQLQREQEAQEHRGQ